MTTTSNISTSFVADAAEGVNSALIDAALVSVAFVVPEGVQLILHGGQEVVVPSEKDKAQLMVDMLADVKGAQKLDREAYKEKGEIKVVSRRAFYLSHQDPEAKAQKDFETRILYLYNTEGKIHAIKAYRDGTKCALKEAKRAVEELVQHNTL